MSARAPAAAVAGGVLASDSACAAEGAILAAAGEQVHAYRGGGSYTLKIDNP